MSWMYYLLEVNLYLILFYALYDFLLRRETWYQYNRAYLLGSSALAFVIPFTQLGILKPAPAPLVSAPVITSINYFTETKAAPVSDPAWTRDDILLAIYLIIVLCLLISLAIKITRLIMLSRKGMARDFGKWKIINTNIERGAFSFFNYLFLSTDMAASDTVITHELVHIKQKHSWDIIYLELFRIINWFNPVAYLLQRRVKELHEFIADEAVTRSKEQIDTYTDFLVANAYGTYQHQLTNNLFNQSLLKKRIMMLHQKRSGKTARLKYLFALPLLGGLLCASTLAFAKDYGWIDIAPRKALRESSKTVNHETVQSPALPESAKANKPGDKIPLLGKGSIGFIIDPRTYNFKTLTWMSLKFQKKGYKMDFKEYKDDENNPMLKISLRKTDSKPNSGASATYRVDELKKTGYAIFVGADPEKNDMHVVSHKFVFLKNDTSRIIRKQTDSTIKSEVKPQIDQQIHKSTNKLPPPAWSQPAFGQLSKHLARYTRYPTKEFEQRIAGNVIIEVTVNNEHKIADPKVTNDARPAFANEAVRALKLYTDTVNTAPGTYIVAVQFNVLNEKMTRSFLPAEVDPKIRNNPNFAAVVELGSFFKD